MGLRLNITAGNDKRVVLQLLNGLRDESREPFPVELSEDVAVKMVSEVGTRHAVSFVVGDEGRVLLDLKGSDYKIGLWGIEVVGRLNGAKWRAYGDSMIHYTATTERGAEQVTVQADDGELTLVVGYATDIVPRKTSELVNDGADGEHPFATEEQLKKYAPLNSPTFTGFPVYNDSGQQASSTDIVLATKNWVYRFVEWFKTQANGIASLVNGKVPAAQIPDLPYIPSNKKGAANGVAELDANRKVFNDQLYFAPRGTTTAAAMGGELEAGLYLVNGFKVSDEVLDGDGANGFLLQGTGASRGQLLVVGRAATGDVRELTEVYSRRWLPTPKRWTAWSKGGGGMAEFPPTILPNPMVKTSEGVYEFTAEVGKLYNLEKWDNLADVLRVHLPTPSDPSRGWKIGFIVQDNMSESSWTHSDLFFMEGNREIINVQQLFDKSTQIGWQYGPWQHGSPQMILFKWVGRQWVVESFTNDILYPFAYSLERENDSYIVMKGSNYTNYRVYCPQYSMMSQAEAYAGTSNQNRVITASVLKAAIKKHTSDKANADDVYTKSEADERFQPKGNYLTEHQDISGKQDVQHTAVYTADSIAADFRPMQLGTVADGGKTYTLYRFLYRTEALPANSSMEIDLSALMGDYAVKEWTSADGFVDSHKMSSGRTDNLNNVCIIQQLTKSTKKLYLRTYADLSAKTALLQLEFYGEKNG